MNHKKAEADQWNDQHTGDMFYDSVFGDQPGNVGTVSIVVCNKLLPQPIRHQVGIPEAAQNLHMRMQ